MFAEVNCVIGLLCQKAWGFYGNRLTSSIIDFHVPLATWFSVKNDVCRAWRFNAGA